MRQIAPSSTFIPMISRLVQAPQVTKYFSSALIRMVMEWTRTSIGRKYSSDFFSHLQVYVYQSTSCFRLKKGRRCEKRIRRSRFPSSPWEEENRSICCLINRTVPSCFRHVVGDFLLWARSRPQPTIFPVPRGSKACLLPYQCGQDKNGPLQESREELNTGES